MLHILLAKNTHKQIIQSSGDVMGRRTNATNVTRFNNLDVALSVIFLEGHSCQFAR